MTVSKCSMKPCHREPRMAISTTRHANGAMFSRVFYDDRTAPKSALLYCHRHGVEAIAQMIAVLVSADSDMIEEAGEITP